MEVSALDIFEIMDPFESVTIAVEIFPGNLHTCTQVHKVQPPPRPSQGPFQNPWLAGGEENMGTGEIGDEKGGGGIITELRAFGEELNSNFLLSSDLLLSLPWVHGFCGEKLEANSFKCSAVSVGSFLAWAHVPLAQGGSCQVFYSVGIMVGVGTPSYGESTVPNRPRRQGSRYSCRWCHQAMSSWKERDGN